MTDKPIIFSPESVRAILNGTKTVTRRLRKTRKGGLFELCPRYDEGDTLWIKEPWYQVENRLFYRADHEPVVWVDGGEVAIIERPRWRPSLFMPRMAGRIRLLVESVEPQLLHAITDEDAMREGFPAIGFFEPAWNVLHPKPPYRFGDNPPVWRIQFRVVEVKD